MKWKNSNFVFFFSTRKISEINTSNFRVSILRRDCRMTGHEHDLPFAPKTGLPEKASWLQLNGLGVLPVLAFPGSRLKIGFKWAGSKRRCGPFYASRWVRSIYRTPSDVISFKSWNRNVVLILLCSSIPAVGYQQKLCKQICMIPSVGARPTLDMHICTYIHSEPSWV
mgnify:CR=1 FL=1